MPAKLGVPVKPQVLLLGSAATLERDLVAALVSENCELRLATGCRHALDLIRAGQIDVLVVDFDVRYQEFLQVASKWRAVDNGCRTLVLADSLEQMALASENRADGVLVKPVDANHLRAVIHNLLAGTCTPAPAESWTPMRLGTWRRHWATSPGRPLPGVEPSRGIVWPPADEFPDWNG